MKPFALVLWVLSNGAGGMGARPKHCCERLPAVPTADSASPRCRALGLANLPAATVTAFASVRECCELAPCNLGPS